MIKYIVSYQLCGGLCGNRVFDCPEDALQYIKYNQHGWKSHTLFSYEPVGLVNELTEVEIEV